MRKRHLPQRWLFTDSRMGKGLWAALERLPRGAGVVIRDPRIAESVEAIARRRGLVTTVSGKSHVGSSGRRGRGPVVTASAHNRRELVAARRGGADLVFVSPVFATRSHPAVKPLGRVRFGLLTRSAKVRIAALGGMTQARFRSLRCFRIHGWGAIDAWM